MATVRIDGFTHATLNELSNETGETVKALLAKAVEHYRRAHILAATNDEYETLRNDREAWAEEMSERALWDNTLSGGVGQVR